MKTSLTHKPSIWSRLNIGKIAFVVVALVFIILLVVAVFLGAESDDQEKAGLRNPASVPTHSESLPSENHGNDDAEYPNESACENTLNGDELASFVHSVMDYEEAFQSPPSPEKNRNISEISTIEYQQAHTVSESQESSGVIVKLLRDDSLTNKTTVTCTVNADGSRLAASLVWITTSFINDEGVEEVNYSELRIPLIHYSTWVVSEGRWIVTSEE